MITRVSLNEAAWFARRLLKLCPDGRADEWHAMTHMLRNRQRMAGAWAQEAFPAGPPFPTAAEPVVGGPAFVPAASGGARPAMEEAPPARTVPATLHSPRDKAFLNALLSSYEALGGTDRDPTWGALSFHHHETAPFGDGHARATALIGRFLFYR